MDYSTSISTSYADTYDKTSSQLSDKLTSTDFSQASDDELMSCLLYTSPSPRDTR